MKPIFKPKPFKTTTLKHIYKGGSWYQTIKDKNNKLIHYSTSGDHWDKYERDEEGKLLYFAQHTGYWDKRTYKNGKTIIETSDNITIII